jgi:uncharacterized protein YqeY
MTLLERIDQDYITALKQREALKVDVLRLIKSSLKNEAIKLGGLGTELTDQQIMSVINREVKQRNDSIEQYKAGGRPELAAKEQEEVTILNHYLPQAIGEDELSRIIDDTLNETGASQKVDMGKVMGVLKQKLTNPADVSRAAGIVQQRLQ